MGFNGAIIVNHEESLRKMDKFIETIMDSTYIIIYIME